VASFVCVGGMIVSAGWGHISSGSTPGSGCRWPPAIWLVNFALLYILNPTVAASIPAAWAPDSSGW